MQETVVLVHGVLLGGWVMRPLARRLRARDFRAVIFNYPSRRRSVSENAAALTGFVHGLQSPVVHLVGHSLGGLVILQALQTSADLPPGRVVLLGSPVQGSLVARRLARHVWGRWLLGRSLEVGLLHAASRWTADRQPGVIAGCLPLGIGRLLGGLPGPHDGTVTVDETAMASAQDSVILNVTHMGLVFSASVARKVCDFIEHGRFENLDRTA